jgi:hypothetical protein
VTEMLAEAAGGPQRYSVRSMEESHRELLITGDEWDAFMDDLNQSLDVFAVPQQEVRGARDRGEHAKRNRCRTGGGPRGKAVGRGGLTKR